MVGQVGLISTHHDQKKIQSLKKKNLTLTNLYLFKEKTMKKVIAILSIAALAACGGQASKEVKADSAVVKADTVAVDSVKK